MRVGTDLQDIGDLEGYVRATGVMLFFLSKKYFTSRNCLREIKASLEQEKPLVLVHEQQEDKGGGRLDAIQAECREDAMRTEIFGGRVPITWHRISHYQNLSLKLIASQMLQHGPANREKTSPPVLVLPGEITVSELGLRKPVVLWCSTANPGAAAAAQELITAMPGGDAVRVVHSKPDVLQVEANGEMAAMLLYLNKDTWVRHGEALELDVRSTHNFRQRPWSRLRANFNNLGASIVRHSLNSVRMSGMLNQHGPEVSASANKMKIIMVHENDESRGSCEFASFFDSTPQELIDDGIYKDITIALHTPPHRAVSLALVAQALGAVKRRRPALILPKRRRVRSPPSPHLEMTPGEPRRLTHTGKKMSAAV